MSENNEISILHKRGDPLEQLGRLSIPTFIQNALVRGTPLASFSNPKESDAMALKEKLKNTKTEGKIEVYLGHSPYFREMKRLFSRDRKTNFFLRMGLGLPGTAIVSIITKLTRTDYYNPFTETAHVYHPNKAIALHEVGHATDYDQAKYPGGKAIISQLVPPLGFKDEWQASRNAMKHLDKKEQSDAGKILEPGLGSHLGATLLPFVGALVNIPTGIATYWGSVLAGHIHSRVSNKNIFFNGEPVALKAASTKT